MNLEFVFQTPNHPLQLHLLCRSLLPRGLALLEYCFSEAKSGKKTCFKSISDLLTLLGQQTCRIIFPLVCFQTFQPIHLQGIMSYFVGLSKTHKITSLTCLFPSTCATARNPTKFWVRRNVAPTNQNLCSSARKHAAWSIQLRINHRLVAANCVKSIDHLTQ